MHVIAAKAVAFGEALTPEFQAYATHIIATGKAFGEALKAGGLALVTDGKDTHLQLVDLRPKAWPGKWLRSRWAELA